jgi:hypothetical protein
MRPTRTSVTGAVLAGLLLAGACTSGGNDAMSTESADSAGSAGEAPVAGLNGSVGERSSANRTTVQTRAVIRKGEVALVTKDIPVARERIADLLARHGGYLAAEQSSNDRSGRPEQARLVLRVPEPAFDTVMEALGNIGRAEHSDRKSEDVTTEVIDVDSRVATQRASLARLQRFLGRTTEVEDLIRLESEIATRQAALESLLAQQAYLADQTAMSSITVTLRTPAAPPQHRALDDAGFVAGLANGWNALKTVLVAGATVLGALLPFAVAFALVGVPAWLLVRTAARRRRSTAPPVAPDAG